ncbi:hypothetical protein BJY00DRAFT_319625 [Aspergillus carlsbadensis]|nr:hypothetical protein BJY00DRAFT_319625 [Aspergillus carlsbadensis]
MTLFNPGSKPPQREEYRRVGSEETLGGSGAAPDDVPDISACKPPNLDRSLWNTNTAFKLLIALCGVVLTACAFGHLALTIYGPDRSVRRLISSPVPPPALRKVTFSQEAIYSSRPNPESDRAWDSLLPPGRGFVFIPNWKEYDLPEGQETPWGMIYSVSLFHQLHCLGQLRRFTWMFLDAIVQNDSTSMEEIRTMMSSEIAGDHIGHINHCFDYLRQSIMCAGDMAIEWPRAEPSGERIVVDGWGIPHECEDWDNIMDYMRANHFNMSTTEEIAPLHPDMPRA